MFEYEEIPLQIFCISIPKLLRPAPADRYLQKTLFL